MRITEDFFLDLDENIFNLFEDGIRITYFKKKEAHINLIKAVVNLGGEQYKNGTAHFLEHLKFWNGNVNLYDMMNNFGNIMNANTTKNETNFLLYCSKETIRSTLDILTAYLLNHKYTIEEFTKEKEIILNEIKGYHSILVDESEKLEYVKKIIGEVNQISDFSKKYLENISYACYQKSNIHYYIIGDFPEFTYNDTVLTKGNIDLVIDNDIILYNYDNIHLFLKILYHHMGGNEYYFTKNNTLKINLKKSMFDKVLSNKQLNEYIDYVISYIIKVYEDVNLLVEFLEKWRFVKGDFTRVGNLLKDKEKLIKLLNEGF